MLNKIIAGVTSTISVRAQGKFFGMQTSAYEKKSLRGSTVFPLAPFRSARISAAVAAPLGHFFVALRKLPSCGRSRGPADKKDNQDQSALGV